MLKPHVGIRAFLAVTAMTLVAATPVTSTDVPPPPTSEGAIAAANVGPQSGSSSTTYFSLHGAVVPMRIQAAAAADPSDAVRAVVANAVEAATEACALEEILNSGYTKPTGVPSTRQTAFLVLIPVTPEACETRRITVGVGISDAGTQWILDATPLQTSVASTMSAAGSHIGTSVDVEQQVPIYSDAAGIHGLGSRLTYSWWWRIDRTTDEAGRPLDEPALESMTCFEAVVLQGIDPHPTPVIDHDCTSRHQ